MLRSMKGKKVEKKFPIFLSLVDTTCGIKQQNFAEIIFIRSLKKALIGYY